MSNTTKRIEWEKRIQDWKASGLSKAKWCRDNECNVHQMHYWVKKLDEYTLPLQNSQEYFLPIKVADKSHKPIGSVFIHIDQMSVEVQPGVDIELLSNVLYVLQS